LYSAFYFAHPLNGNHRPISHATAPVLALPSPLLCLAVAARTFALTLPAEPRFVKVIGSDKDDGVSSVFYKSTE
jgi:hypothetical protein